MGQHKVKQYNREQYLAHNPYCCFCGAPATTTDHIPSRQYFLGRVWPEGFEFPACVPCNAETRLDEQVSAFVLNLRLINNNPEIEALLVRILRAIITNSPDVAHEWKSGLATSVSGIKRAFREAFGPLGDELRGQNCGMINLGPLTRQRIERFTTKLAKALFYKHTGRILDGYIFPAWHNIYIDPIAEQHDRLRKIQHFTKSVIHPTRANQPLTDQFLYRYTRNLDPPWLFAAVIFSEQMMFDLIVLSEPAMDWILTQAGQSSTKANYDFFRQPLTFRNEATAGLFPHADFPRHSTRAPRKGFQRG